jgi:peptidyl-prolyl cis-trans isomerase B (cyclophilin B)
MGDSHGNSRPIFFMIYMSIVVAALAVGAFGCGDSRDSSTATEASSIATEASSTTTEANSKDAAAASRCNDVEAPKAGSVSYRAPRQTVRKGEKLTAVVSTSCGTFSIALDVKRFPTTVNSFVFLARKGFYEGASFDRAAAGTFLQGGNPPGDAGGPGYSVNGEIPSGFIYRHGVVAMWQVGEASPGRAGSQFFIVLAKPWLDFSPLYAPLGTVEDGFDMLDSISKLGPPAPGPHNIGVAGPIGQLRREVLIEKISIQKG